jgi:hypothetical protein
MAGGLLNIQAVGNANVILTGTPTKTFFKVVYSKYTNFGLQKFRIDYNGLREFRLTEPSTFTFKIPRYADLLLDTYLCVTLPDIWSPIYHPSTETSFTWAPYHYRWIRNLGTHMIREVSITCGSLTIQKYSGQYLGALVERDFTEEKKSLFYEMTGNQPELYDVANAYGRTNVYPSAFSTNPDVPAEPSIRGRKLYIPLNTWFSLDSRCAFPLIALQYNELNITITLRPIQELFQVRDVFDVPNSFPYIQPDFNLDQFQMYRFLQAPPSVDLSRDKYTNKSPNWNADIHLLSTYGFLSEEERVKIAMEDQVYLVKDVFEYNFENIIGSKKVKLTSTGMVANWMWYFQRNDVNMRNEWSNYTNWAYRKMPSDIVVAPQTISEDTYGYLVQNSDYRLYGPAVHPNGTLLGNNTGFFITGEFNVANIRDIMVSMGIVLNGDYRENILPEGVFQYVEKYIRTAGNAPPGIYCYNFCLNTSPFEYQPSGAINLSKFNTIELEITTIVPAVDPERSMFNILCDNNNNPIGITKQNWRLYDYTYNMTLFEERYNVLSFMGGNCGMLYAR